MTAKILDLSLRLDVRRTDQDQNTAAAAPAML
jgi:hypothetical protein